MIVNGKEIAERVYAALGARSLTLGILMVGADPVTGSFVRAKERAAARLGVTVERETLSETAGEVEIIDALVALSDRTDGVIVQLPLPHGIDTERVLEMIPPGKDVDGISPKPLVRPPVAGALEEILKAEAVQVFDADAVVVGAGRLVGAPCASLLSDLGAHVVVLRKGDPLDPLKTADIIILGAGEPGMIGPGHIKDGVVIIDAGTSESSGKVVGDADPACAEKASVFTPVPGGVGPVAIAMIFKNLYDLSDRKSGAAQAPPTHLLIRGSGPSP
jgi:methylenetetrahydrofolate dehydrogenase (NADP+)/methenyltetrahydrofolate cyclohydrolase